MWYSESERINQNTNKKYSALKKNTLNKHELEKDKI